MKKSQFTRAMWALKLGACRKLTLGEATADRLLNLYTPKQRIPPIHLGAADLTVADLKGMGFEITKA